MSLQHSNIVQVLDLGVAGGRYFLALELVDGWDLERILQRAYGGRHGLAAGAEPLRRRRASAARWRTRTRKTPRRQAAGDRPPRHQPEQRADQRAGRGQAGRLRHRQGAAQARADRGRRHQGQDRVHVARAGAGRRDRPAVRHLLRRLDAVPDGDGQAAVRGRRRHRVAAAACRRRSSRRPRRPSRRSGPSVSRIIMRAMRLRAQRALPDRRRDAGRRRARAAHRVPVGGADRAEAVAGAAGAPRRRADDRQDARARAASTIKTWRHRPVGVGTSFELDDFDIGDRDRASRRSRPARSIAAARPARSARRRKSAAGAAARAPRRRRSLPG